MKEKEKMKKTEESRKKIREKRGKRKKERLTQSDRVLVETRESERTRDKRDLLKSVKNSDLGQLERKKWIEVLSQCEQRYSYETWEARKVFRTCIEDDEGYRVKANQVGRREWSKKRVDRFEVDLRDYESKVPTYDEKVNPSNKGDEWSLLDKKIGNDRSTLTGITESEESSDGIAWGFWKYYRETDAQRVKVWKKGVLQKKSMRKNEITSWDMGSFRSIELEWYERRRSRKRRRRYVRDGQVLAPFGQSYEGESRKIVQEVFIKSRRDRQEKRRRGDRKGRNLISLSEKRKRSYNQFQNPEERKKNSTINGKNPRSRETGFQSRLRAQTGVERKRSKERVKPLGLDQKAVALELKMGITGRKSRDSGKKKRSKKVYVWTSQLGRFRYGQRRKGVEQDLLELKKVEDLDEKKE